MLESFEGGEEGRKRKKKRKEKHDALASASSIDPDGDQRRRSFHDACGGTKVRPDPRSFPRVAPRTRDMRNPREREGRRRARQVGDARGLHVEIIYRAIDARL